MSRKWGKRGRQSFKTTGESALNAKVEIRRAMMELLPGPINVFDVFAGDGAMFRAVWHEAGSYIGCDAKHYRQRERKAYVCDNVRLLRALDLGRFNLFDIDAKTSPWDQALVISDRRKVAPGERIGLVITEGSSMGMTLGNVSASLVEVAELTKKPMAGAMRMHDSIIARAVGCLTNRMGCKLVKHLRAEVKSGSRMRYLGLCLEGLPGSRAE